MKFRPTTHLGHVSALYFRVLWWNYKLRKVASY